MFNFYDTCSLLELQNRAFESHFIVSNITFCELELIKTSGTKDEETKWAARQLLHLLNKNFDKYTVISYSTKEIEPLIQKYGLMLNNDSRIICTALWALSTNQFQFKFVTSDLSCKTIAESLGIPTMFLSSFENDDDYTGFKEIQMDDNDLAIFYEEILPNNVNLYKLGINEYLLITDNCGCVIDKYKWTLSGYEKIIFHQVESAMFGKITPKNNDPYQYIAIDSLASNQITMLRGPAGTGKSYLAFGYMFNLLEHNKIDKIIIFCNTVATKGSAKLGFYPGSRTEKLLDSQIGNLLESKLGDKVVVEGLIREGKLILLPMSDIRGYDTTGMNAAIYISEAQNLDVELMRLALQRIGEDSICIIDGDFSHQVDMSMYAGIHNGMRRVSQVFRGKHFYGEVELKNIYRSEIAKTAELM